MKKLFIIFGTLFITLVFSNVVFGAGTTGYQPLTPIPGLTSSIQTGGSSGTSGTGFASYLRALYVWGVAAASGLAVMMIMWGGVEYMTSAGGGGVEEAKKKISAAITGLLLALGSYIILYTINRDLLNLQFTIGAVNVVVNKNSSVAPVVYTNNGKVIKAVATGETTQAVVSSSVIFNESDYPGLNKDNYILLTDGTKIPTSRYFAALSITQDVIKMDDGTYLYPEKIDPATNTYVWRKATEEETSTLSANVIPYKTAQADPRIYPPGTEVYIKSLDGYTLPDGSTHDGKIKIVGGSANNKDLGAAIRIFSPSADANTDLKLSSNNQDVKILNVPK